MMLKRNYVLRQLLLKDSNSHSWFVYVNDILSLYNFESAFELMENIPNKESWKSYVKRKLESAWRLKISEMAEGKSSLQFLSIKSMKIGSVHNIWTFAGYDSVSIKKANVKVRLLTGVYTLQYNRSKFNKHKVSATCPLCELDVENRQHFLLNCSETESTRRQFLSMLKTVVSNIDSGLERTIFQDSSLLTQLILDVSNPDIPIILQSEELCEKIESISRGLIFAVHRKRCEIMNICV